MEYVTLNADEEDLGGELLELEQDLPPVVNKNKVDLLDDSQDDVEPDIVFIGGGPVGLWTAVQLKLRSPNARILVIEKYAEYQRSHVLRLQAMSFINAYKEPRMKQLIKDIPSTVRTNDLEEKLLTLSKSLGIQMRFKSVDSVADVLTQYESARVVVGSDGSHSIVRNQIFENDMSVKKSLQHIVDIKYEVYGDGHHMKNVAHLYPTLKIMNHIAEEHIGKAKHGVSPITLRLLISKEEFEPLKNASFKAPYYIPTHFHLIPAKLLESITIWLNVKAQLYGETRVPGSEKLTALDLSVYRSRKFARTKKATNHACCLVGDAAFGVPFFRALNNGLLCGSKLAEVLSRVYESKFTDMDLLVNDYDSYVSHLSNTEIEVAKGKKLVLKSAGLFITVSGALPWQVHKWNSRQVEKFTKTDPGFSEKAARSTLTCLVCTSEYISDSNPPGHCGHSGVLHTVDDCRMIQCASPKARSPEFHWSCCESSQDSHSCPKSPPHEHKALKCSLCHVSYYQSNPGNCIHKGSWHTLLNCNFKCAFELKNNIGLVGKQHWGCCFEKDKSKKTCSKSQHVPIL